MSIAARHQWFITTHSKDLCWLRPNLISLKRFAEGFAPPVIVVRPEDKDATKAVIRETYPEARLRVHLTPLPEQGPKQAGRERYWKFMQAQLAMMSSDLYCDPETEFVWLIGSDCFLTGPLRPESFFIGGKPLMLHRDYKLCPDAARWRLGVSSGLGILPQAEFMQWLPLIYPVRLYKAARDAVEAHVKRPVLDWMLSDEAYDICSESNLLGAVAWYYHSYLYHWFDLVPGSNPPVANPLCQWWSHGGLDRVAQYPPQYAGRTPRSVMSEILNQPI